MKKVGFIGGCDKTDWIIYIAKMLTMVQKRVLVIDATIMQKARYVIPTMTPTVSYITTYEGMDVAIGFKQLQDIVLYLGKSAVAELEYDYILIDIDTGLALENMALEDSYKSYFATTMDTYSIKRGLESIQNLKQPIELTRILFTKQQSKEELEYINYLATNLPVKWNEKIIYFPFEEGDQTAIFENQRIEKIRLKNLTEDYRTGVIHIAEELLEGMDPSELKKVIRMLERGAY